LRDSDPISGTDVVTVELVKPFDMPAIVRITWAPQLTVCDPRRYTEVAVTAMKVLAPALDRAFEYSLSGQITDGDGLSRRRVLAAAEEAQGADRPGAAADRARILVLAAA
jgi:hypothetical protein